MIDESFSSLAVFDPFQGYLDVRDGLPARVLLGSFVQLSGEQKFSVIFFFEFFLGEFSGIGVYLFVGLLRFAFFGVHQHFYHSSQEFSG